MHNQSSRHYTCAVIGEWHLAFVTAACLAKVGHRTALINPNKNHEWKEFPQLALNEPGLPEMIAEAKKLDNLHFENGFSDSWTADTVWLAIDTPVNDQDEADTSPLLEAIEGVARHKNAKEVFAISSQIPLGFSDEVEKKFGLKVAYIPENLRLGKGIETFLRADRTVIGANTDDTRNKVQAL